MAVNHDGIIDKLNPNLFSPMFSINPPSQSEATSPLRPFSSFSTLTSCHAWLLHYCHRLAWRVHQNEGCTCLSETSDILASCLLVLALLLSSLSKTEMSISGYNCMKVSSFLPTKVPINRFLHPRVVVNILQGCSLICRSIEICLGWALNPKQPKSETMVLSRKV